MVAGYRADGGACLSARAGMRCGGSATSGCIFALRWQKLLLEPRRPPVSPSSSARAVPTSSSKSLHCNARIPARTKVRTKRIANRSCGRGEHGPHAVEAFQHVVTRSIFDPGNECRMYLTAGNFLSKSPDGVVDAAEVARQHANTRRHC